MVNKSIIGATCACLVVGSFNVSAIFIEADWKNAGDGLITYDANTGLEWLDLTVTHGLSHDLDTRILGQRELEGLRLATDSVYLSSWENVGGVLHLTGYYTYDPFLAAFDLVRIHTIANPCDYQACGLLEGDSRMFSIYPFVTGHSTAVKAWTSDVFFLSVLIIIIGGFIMRGVSHHRRHPKRRRRFKYYKRDS